MFSIVIPTFNRLDLAQRMIQTALEQDYRSEYRVIVLDDASSDGTMEYVKALGHPRLMVLGSKTRLGITGNWRRMNELDLGSHFAIFGQDDLMDPNYLSVMGELVKKEPEATLYHSHFRFIDETGANIREARPMPGRETAGQYLRAMFSGQRDSHGSGYFIPTRYFREAGGIPDWPKLLFADDALWLTLMSRGFKACAPQSLFSVRLHTQSTGNTSSSKDWMIGLEKYFDFLNGLRADSEEVCYALDEFQAAYFQTWSNVILGKHFVEQTRQNLKADKDLVARVEDVLKRCPGGSERVAGGDRKVRVHRWINTNMVTRGGYNLLSKFRRGAQ